LTISKTANNLFQLKDLNWVCTSKKIIKFHLPIQNNVFFFPGWCAKVKSAAWALDRGVCAVICNGTQDHAIKMILSGRRIGTFFTERGGSGGNATTDVLAENGELCEGWHL